MANRVNSIATSNPLYRSNASPSAMSAYHFVLGMILASYLGFSRLNHLRFLEREPMLTRMLKVLRLPGQSTFWRFLAALGSGI
jgi:nitrate reductase gamma subunit